MNYIILAIIWLTLLIPLFLLGKMITVASIMIQESTEEPLMVQDNCSIDSSHFQYGPHMKLR